MKKELNKELVLKKEISPVVNEVTSITISSKEDMTNATTVLSQLNKFADSIKEEKEKLTKPINEALKEIRSRYKPIEDMLANGIMALKGKMSVYQTAQLAIQKKAEDKIAQQLADGKIKKIETATKHISAIEVPEAKVSTDDGSASFKKIKKFEVMDIVVLANANAQAITPNEVYIRAQMNAGIELPGVRYFEELSVVNRRN